MSLPRTNPLSSPRLRSASTLAALGAALLAGSALTACSSNSPFEPTAASQLAVPTGPNHTGFQVGWGVTGGNGNGGDAQSAGKVVAGTPKDTTKAPK